MSLNKKQNMDLDTISKIDDDIIEKNTEKRIRLLRKKSRIMRNRVIAIIAAAVLLIVALTSVFVVLFAKQVPIYEGMTAHAYNGGSTVDAGGMGISFLSAGGSDQGGFDWLNDGDNGNHYGHDKNGKNTETAGAIGTEKETSSLDVPMQEVAFYTEKNTDFYITVHISNPDNFEILSFTLNGKKYSSYMFEDGSDMENLILKCNVGDAEGIVEYTIDAIKYVDGTAIKDVVMEGNRTIKIGVYTDKQPVAAVSNESTGLDSISLDVSLTDTLDLIKMSGGSAWIELMRNGVSVERKTLSITEKNSISFESLEIGAEYEYKVVARYDALDGKGTVDHVLRSGKLTTKSVFDIVTSEITQESASFGIEWNDIIESKALKSLGLYRGGEKVTDLAIDTTTVDGLLSGVEYILVGTYEYNGQTVTVNKVFTTVAKATPVIELDTSEVTQESFKFDITVTDVDNVGAITKIELIHGDDVTVAESLETREFKDLLSNNDYSVKVTYTYDLNDGVGDQNLVKELTVKTEAKATPTLEINDLESNIYEISGKYSYTDTDSVITSNINVELFKGETLVKNTNTENFEFTELEMYTDYMVKLSFNYDLNDGVGIQTLTKTKDIKTLPYFSVTDCKIANTSAVSEGETIYMQATIDNPRDLSVSSVVVNGVSYNVVSTSTNNTNLFVEIVYNDQFAGGETELKIEEITVTDNNVSYSSSVENAVSDNVFINGKLEVLSFTYVNEDLEPIDWTFPSRKSYLLITFSNPTGYKIDSITIEGYGDGSRLIKVDNNTYYCETGFDGIPDGLYDNKAEARATQVAYSNDYLSKTISCSLPETSLRILNSDEIHYISTPSDLLDMDDNYYYELKNDIDLSGIEWRGGDFEGVFDGKGYSIENLSFVTSLKNEHAYLGLFSNARGYIQNLNMESITIITELSSDDDSGYDLYCGGIAGAGGTFINCTIDENSLISVKNQTGGCYVGGIVGSGIDTAQNCINYGTVTGGGLVGGIVGKGENGIIRECLNYGAISGEADLGGISGGGGNISDCINYGSVSGSEGVGGIAGWGGNKYISNCLNLGKITGKSDLTAGIAGARWNSKIFGCVNLGPISAEGYTVSSICGEDQMYVDNCYGIVKYSTLEVTCTFDQLNSKEFYTETLGWSEDIWDFSNLDVENGKYPTLK